MPKILAIHVLLRDDAQSAPNEATDASVLRTRAEGREGPAAGD
jgi:hypothetical protein